MLRKRSTAMAPNVKSDSDDNTTAATPNAEQRPSEVMMAGQAKQVREIAVFPCRAEAWHDSVHRRLTLQYRRRKSRQHEDPDQRVCDGQVDNEGVTDCRTKVRRPENDSQQQ